SEEAVKQHGLAPVARIVDSEWAGLDPAQMGLGPVHAATPILKRNALALNDLDYWEINEAFAAQVLGCLEAWKDARYCKDELGLDSPMGELDDSKLNVDGGAIALGHPVGASGARIVLHLLKTLKRKNAKRGMASICIGGGLGGAMLVEALLGGIMERADSRMLAKHWRWELDKDRLAWLTFDKQGESANTFSREALE